MVRDPDAQRRAKIMRKDMTGAEARVWSLLRDRRLIQRKFRRQHSIGPWVVDFACVAIHLAIEVDGLSHDDPDQRAFDVLKEEYLRASGWRLLRVTNDEVYQSLSVVESKIISAIGD